MYPQHLLMFGDIVLDVWMMLPFVPFGIFRTIFGMSVFGHIWMLKTLTEQYEKDIMQTSSDQR